ncbi:hypothetical protein EYR38_008308 [Pleurotus pulmonarius]|nr:hypothetical protein EYR38_008308 [Pleurotus pulmonarius]
MSHPINAFDERLLSQKTIKYFDYHTRNRNRIQVEFGIDWFLDVNPQAEDLLRDRRDGMSEILAGSRLLAGMEVTLSSEHPSLSRSLSCLP